jgi:FG-GAP repeat
MSRTNWIRITGIAAIIAACSLASVASAATWTETDKLTASDGADGDRFGNAVSISGDTAIIGATGVNYYSNDYAGAAYVLTNTDGVWSQSAKLTPTDRAGYDQFGSSVAISGNKAIIGAVFNDDDGPNSGSAYVFEDEGSGWTQTTKLTANDAAENDNFASSVAISGNTAIVGARYDDQHGSAYVFADDGSGWSQVAKLTAADAATDDNFGIAVSISGSLAIVGAAYSDDRGSYSGSAYIFEHDGSSWVQVAELIADDGDANDQFGVAVSISGTTAIVGAMHNDDRGAAYVFEDDGSGWGQVAKLVAADGDVGDSFGRYVSINGTTAVIGAPLDDDNGSASGSAYVFEKNGSGWSQTNKLTASDGSPSDYFGMAIAIDDGTGVMGVAFDDDNGETSGSAYIFSASSEPVPEPMSMIFFGTGVVGVFGFVSRRRMRKAA